MQTRIRLSAALAITAMCTLWLSACGSSSEGGGPSPPTAPLPMITFTSDRVAGANSIALRSSAGSTSSVLQLEVFATEVPGIQAVDFQLFIPNALLRFDTFERGELIGAGAQVVFGGAGSNTLSFQILRTVQGTPTPSGRILTLTFTAIASGSGRIDFLNQEAEDLFGVTIPGIDWIGGSVQVIL